MFETLEQLNKQIAALEIRLQRAAKADVSRSKEDDQLIARGQKLEQVHRNLFERETELEHGERELARGRQELDNERGSSQEGRESSTKA